MAVMFSPRLESAAMVSVLLNWVDLFSAELFHGWKFGAEILFQQTNFFLRLEVFYERPGELKISEDYHDLTKPMLTFLVYTKTKETQNSENY